MIPTGEFNSINESGTRFSKSPHIRTYPNTQGEVDCITCSNKLTSIKMLQTKCILICHLNDKSVTHRASNKAKAKWNKNNCT